MKSINIKSEVFLLDMNVKKRKCAMLTSFLADLRNMRSAVCVTGVMSYVTILTTSQ